MRNNEPYTYEEYLEYMREYDEYLEYLEDKYTYNNRKNSNVSEDVKWETGF